MFDVRISDHAIVRYLERVSGLDVDAVRAEILAATEGPAALGAKSVRKADLTYVLEHGTVVTIIPDGRQRLPRRR